MKTKKTKIVFLAVSLFFLTSCVGSTVDKTRSSSSRDAIGDYYTSIEERFSGEEKSFNDNLKLLDEAIEDKKPVFDIVDRTTTRAEFARYYRKSCLLDDVSVKSKCVSYSGFGYSFEFSYSDDASPSLKSSQKRSEITDRYDRTIRDLVTDGDDFVPAWGNWREKITVRTSEQLVKSIESGYQPSPVKGSQAESIYEKAIAALKNTVSIKSSDQDKASHIYRYIGANSCYDYDYSKNDSSKDGIWRCHYPEGFFDDGVAVCDGFAKAYSLMANLSGIECRRVFGIKDGETIGHEWCIAKINGNWVTIDPTSANSILNSTTEIVSYNSFMSASNYYESEYKVEEGYDVPPTGSSFDFLSYCGQNASSRAEAANIIKKISNFSETDTMMFRLSYCNSDDMINEIKSAVSESGIKFGTSFFVYKATGVAMITRTGW